MWTQFWDMHSGGSLKEQWSLIFIEAPEQEAKIIFQNRFGHHPYRVTCQCCGEDYSVDEYYSLAKATAYHRGCGYDEDGNTIEEHNPTSWNKYMTLEDFSKRDDVLIIHKEDITPRERLGYPGSQDEEWNY